MPRYTLHGPYTAGDVDYIIEGPDGRYSSTVDSREGLCDLYKGSRQLFGHQFYSIEDAVRWLEQDDPAIDAYKGGEGIECERCGGIGLNPNCIDDDDPQTAGMPTEICERCGGTGDEPEPEENNHA